MQRLKRLSRKRVLSFLLITPILLILQLGIGIFIFSNLQRINNSEDRENKVDTYLRANTRFISNAESAQRGYLLSGDSKYLENYKLDLDEIKKNEDYFNDFPPDQISTEDVKTIRRFSKKKLNEMALTISLFKAGNRDSALAIFKAGEGKIVMDSLRNASSLLRNRIGGELTREKKAERYQFILFLGLIAFLIAFNLFVVRFTYATFKNYTENLEHLVDSLEEANTRMMKFNTMSYHELKTPLRSISGFAQLFRKKFSPQMDAEEAEYIGFITDNVKQMDKIITDMREKYLEEPGNKTSDKNDTTH